MRDKVLTPKLTKPAKKDKSLLIRMTADERAILMSGSKNLATQLLELLLGTI